MPPAAKRYSMKPRHLIPTLLCVLWAAGGMAQPLRTQTTLKQGWRFMKEGRTGGAVIHIHGLGI